MLENFAKAQRAMGIEVSQEPSWIEVPDSEMKKYKSDAFVKEIERSINPKTRFAVVLIRYPDQYKNVKKALDKKGIPS